MAENIDWNEIDKFSQLAAEWWDPNGKCKPLHIINPLRVDYVHEQCDSLVGKCLLDVGCGGGILSESMAKLGANVTGIDLAEESLSVARSHAARNNLDIIYQNQTIEEHANEKPASYDIVTCMELLEHVPDPLAIVKACARLLKPNGKLFLSTINRTRKAQLIIIFGAEYIANILPKGTHDFNRFIRPSELMSWVEKAKLNVDDIIGMEYQVFKNKFKLSQNVDVNYILTAKK